MSERLEKFIFGFVALAFAAVLIFSVGLSAQAEQPEPIHQEMVTDSVEFHQMNVEAVAAAPDFYQMDVLQLASDDSTHEAAPVYLGITNHQNRFNPPLPVRGKSYIYGADSTVTRRYFNMNMETISSFKDHLSAFLSPSEEKQLQMAFALSYPLLVC